MLSVDYSIKDDKNIPPHLTCVTTCGFFRLKEVRQGRVLLVLPRPKYTQSHILFNIYLNIYKYNLIISIHILLIIYLFYTYFIIISKKKERKISLIFQQCFCSCHFFFIFHLYLINLIRISKIFSTGTPILPCADFFSIPKRKQGGDGAPIIESRPSPPVAISIWKCQAEFSLCRAHSIAGFVCQLQARHGRARPCLQESIVCQASFIIPPTPRVLP